jgi:hypothetical protein
MEMKLFINLFKETSSKQFESFIDSSINNHYLDFHSKQNEIKSLNNINVESFQYYNESYNKAVKNYTSCISKLSTIKLGQQHIRSFKLNDLPIYWLTNVSEKHYYHWLMKVLLLNQLLSKNTYFFKQFGEINVILPKDLIDTQDFIKDYFTKNSLKVNFIKMKGSASNYYYLSLLKTLLKTVLLFLKMPTPVLTDSQKQVTFLLTPRPTDYTKDFFKNILSVSDRKSTDAQLIPLYAWLNSNSKQDFKTSKLFWKSKPNVLMLARIAFQKASLLKRLNKISSKNISEIHDKFPSSIIIKELRNVILRENNTIIMYYWLSKYSRKLKHDPLFFYEDEFYPIGRAISLSLKNRKTYGVQHSMISKNHTVYHISELEINPFNKNDNLPLPLKFIVWGDYFKSNFLSHNNLNEKFIIVAGNPTYIKRSKTVLPPPPINNRTTILYCLTTLEVFEKEKTIINDALSVINNLDLHIRFHPLHEFNEKIITDFFDSYNVIFSSQNNIFKEINCADFVITSAHSGVWLDAIIAKKPVIRLITFFRDNIMSCNLLYNISNEQELEQAINLILNKEPEKEFNKLLYLKNDQWIKLFMA